MLEAKAKDSLSEDRHSRGQEQECSRPRPRTKDTKRKCSPKKKKKKVFTKIFQAISKKKKKRSSQKFFKRSPRKNAFQKIFQPLHKILTFQKIVLSSSRGQANFRELEASRPRPRPRTSKSVLEDVLEAKDVLEDSTSVNINKNVSDFTKLLFQPNNKFFALLRIPSTNLFFSLHPKCSERRFKFECLQTSKHSKNSKLTFLTR